MFVVDHLIRYLDFLSYRFFSSSLNRMGIDMLSVGAFRKFPFWHHFYSATFERFFLHRANFIRPFGRYRLLQHTKIEGKIPENPRKKAFFWWFFRISLLVCVSRRHFFFSNRMRKKNVKKNWSAIKFGRLWKKFG